MNVRSEDFNHTRQSGFAAMAVFARSCAPLSWVWNGSQLWVHHGTPVLGPTLIPLRMWAFLQPGFNSWVQLHAVLAPTLLHAHQTPRCHRQTTLHYGTCVKGSNFSALK